ncbi:GAF domain-containing protein [Acidovorax sp. GBBC 3334]|uniref:GAF domain-containing protein n=1 Tax=Acidovorax sp. GBBC 3334 TaxID=2940496 RepID=UPI002302F706|nr:GAF domain-containing protein [Acidovorax sp. GBBC 3334]MDA8455604.1 GAF domain-containing protein [Acidovorax sp. GBBC 3334]
MTAPLPDNEAERLRALHDLMLLDTSPEERFDRVVRFAAEQLDAPIALVSLVDEHRQWFKSRVGLESSETARDVSFCAHAILQPDLLVVEDARQDPRFADNPFVTGDAHIRFYAGAPLSAPGGERIGTLCVLDTEPRALGGTELAVLKALRELVNEAIAGKEDDA